MKQKLRALASRPISGGVFWLLVAAMVLCKLAVSHFQMVYIWIGGAPVDDELMFRAAQSIRAGEWLGPYDWLTLSKHMFFAVWLALCNWLHLPYLAAGQLLACGAALAASQALAPVLTGRKGRLLVFAALAFSPAITASFTLRVYRDNIFPALCMLFFAGMCGYALRCRRPLKEGLPWLVLAGVGLATAWLCREDGMWLLPFALVGTLVLLAVALGHKCPWPARLARCLVLAVPFVVLAGGIGAYSAMNYRYYGLFTVSDFSAGSFSAAVGAMNRVQAQEWKPLVSVPQQVRSQLYQQVPQLQPLEYWLEEDEDLQNSYRNPKLGDYQAGSFYWALRKAAWKEGVYDSAPKAQAYWQQVADAINALCDSGQLPANGPKRVGTTPPIRAEYILPTLQEGIKSLWHTLTFQDCQSWEQARSLGQRQDLEVWEQYLGQRANDAAVAGADSPYYSPLQTLLFRLLSVIQLVYSVVLPLAFCAALAGQVRTGLCLLRMKAEKGIPQGLALYWTLLLGLLGMALLRCFMIAFMEVAAFQIGTYVMYLSTVHPLLLLYSTAGNLTFWRNHLWQNS